MKVKFNYSKKKIQDICIGEYVKSLDPVSGEIEPQRVLDTFKVNVKKEEQCKITFSDGGFIINSAKHPILVYEDGDWSYKAFKKLREGDIVLRNDKRKVFITKLEKGLDNPEEEFYDLNVKKNHNFFAGNDTLICNHNSVTLTIPFYHYEIELFSQLSDSKGTVETRARHTDQSIIINKWFLRKALNKEDIYLFHINEVPELYDALGFEEAFNELYQKYAKKVPAKHKKKVNAWNLLELFIYERMISGRLYFAFADNVRKSAYKENLYALNLCQEVSQIMRPLDGSQGTPEIGVCILANVNMGYAKIEDLPKCANFIVRFLDTMIDESDFGIKEVEYAAVNRRALGIGVSNLFGYLAKSKLFYNTYEARREVSKFMEHWCYNLHKVSIQLAKERGKCELFEDTVYADGKFPHERFSRPEFLPELDWETLREELKAWGIRNSSLGAVPPAGNCLEFKQKIKTKEGNMNLLDVCKREGLNFENLERGWYNLKNKLELTTKDGDSYAERFYFNGLENTYDIELENGEVIQITKNHKLFVKRGDTYEWVKACDLREGDDVKKI